MRYIRYVCIAIFAIALVAVAMANSEYVELSLLPGEVAGLFALAPKISVPLFVVIFASIIAGLAIGFIWEWVREHNFRAQLAKSERENRRLQREIKRLKAEPNAAQDDVLALLDKAS